MPPPPTISIPPPAPTAPPRRLRLHLRGVVQGVGFRPHAWRLAHEFGLSGWVRNDPAGLIVEVEGAPDSIASFARRLVDDCPPNARVDHCAQTATLPAGGTGFQIQPSSAGRAATHIPPDLATCPDCLRELLDPRDRRHRYPFINCTHCGPRYSIIEALPYDRASTTMRIFTMCAACRDEFTNPADRRFHAQPIACPDCGPRLTLCDPSGQTLARTDTALLQTADALRAGAIVALKGIGGFQLLCDARAAAAIERLRRAKRRPAQPFALMAPDLATIARCCHVDPAEAALLRSPQAPIVLLAPRPDWTDTIDPNVAPAAPALGWMLPTTPLHHLLLLGLGFPLVATSGNRHDEPICTETPDALDRLSGIADLFLVHDRPIARPVDDSLARVLFGETQLLRCARGYAPLRVAPPPPAAHPVILAFGAHDKNAPALGTSEGIILGQHIGDLETPEALAARARAAADLARLLAAPPAAAAADLHPDYGSSRLAERTGLPVTTVPHHLAHTLAVAAERSLDRPFLGVAWDGTGLGTDGTFWGGDWLLVADHTWRRAAHLLPFPLPGAGRAAREPRRSALGLLWQLRGASVLDDTRLAPVRSFTPSERRLLGVMLDHGVQSPRTTSAGRLFDAVAALLDLRQRSSYEGEAAVELEALANGAGQSDPLPFDLVLPAQPGAPLVVDWRPAIESLLARRAAGESPASLAAAFHGWMVEAILRVALHLRPTEIVLAGGCFQNRRLFEGAVTRLRENGFNTHWPRLAPTNDGGLAIGQAFAALRGYEELR